MLVMNQIARLTKINDNLIQTSILKNGNIGVDRIFENDGAINVQIFRQHIFN